MSDKPLKKQNILWRSLALQLFLNYKTMQGPGYLMALKSELTDDEPEKIQAGASFINGHPVFSSVALGAIAARLRGPVDAAKAKEIEEWKHAISSPLGSIGDSLIWERFKPSLLALAVAGVLFAGEHALAVWGWAIVAVLLIYNFSLWMFRSWAFHKGFALAERVSELALHPALPKTKRVLRGLGISAAGLVIASALSNAGNFGSVGQWQFVAGFILMLCGAYLRMSTLTVAFFAVLSSFGIFYLFT